jgi:hypothetical protein
MAKKKTKKYDFRTGFPAHKALNPNKCGPVLETLANLYEGEALLQKIIEKAKFENSPLHAGFVWNNAKAGAKYRLHQARNLLRAIVIVQTTKSGTTSQPAFYYCKRPGNKRGTYKATAQVLSNEDLFNRAYEHLTDRMQSAINSLNTLEDLARKAGDPQRITVVASVVRLVKEANKAVRTLAKMA